MSRTENICHIMLNVAGHQMLLNSKLSGLGNYLVSYQLNLQLVDMVWKTNKSKSGRNYHFNSVCLHCIVGYTTQCIIPTAAHMFISSSESEGKGCHMFVSHSVIVKPKTMVCESQSRSKDV